MFSKHTLKNDQYLIISNCHPDFITLMLWGSQTLYMDFPLCGVWTTTCHIVQQLTIYIIYN